MLNPTDVTLPKLLDQATKLNSTFTGLKADLQTVAPELAQRLDTKPVILSKSPWGTLAVAAVAYTAAKYGLALDDTLVNLIAAVGLLVGSYLMRLTVKQPATLTGADPVKQ